MFSIIIPTLNEEESIVPLLESLDRQSYSDFEVMVVDGGSKDKTVEVARKYGAEVLVHVGLGEFQSRNVGARLTKGKVLLFTCADVILARDLLNKVNEWFSQNSRLIALAGPGIPYDAALKGKLLYAAYNLFRYLSARLPGRLRRFSTSANFLAVRKEAFERIGGFDHTDINADGLMGRRLLEIGNVCFSLDTYVFISARRMKKVGFLRFLLHYLYVLENFFPFMSRTELIKGAKERSRSAHRKIHEEPRKA